MSSASSSSTFFLFSEENIKELKSQQDRLTSQAASLVTAVKDAEEHLQQLKNKYASNQECLQHLHSLITKASTESASIRTTKDAANIQHKKASATSSTSSSKGQAEERMDKYLEKHKFKTPFMRHGLKQMDIMYDKNTIGSVSQIIAGTDSGKSTGLILWAVRRWFFVLEKCKREGISLPSATHFFILTVPTSDAAYMLYEFMTEELKKIYDRDDLLGLSIGSHLASNLNSPVRIVTGSWMLEKLRRQRATEEFRQRRKLEANGMPLKKVPDVFTWNYLAIDEAHDPREDYTLLIHGIAQYRNITKRSFDLILCSSTAGEDAFKKAFPNIQVWTMDKDDDAIDIDKLPAMMEASSTVAIAKGSSNGTSNASTHIRAVLEKYFSNKVDMDTFSNNSLKCHVVDLKEFPLEHLRFTEIDGGILVSSGTQNIFATVEELEDSIMRALLMVAKSYTEKNDDLKISPVVPNAGKTDAPTLIRTILEKNFSDKVNMDTFSEETPLLCSVKLKNLPDWPGKPRTLVRGMKGLTITGLFYYK
jgi:FtsZ-binding cell division protein ZapB